MGYDLHITRRADWSGAGNDITADEWLKLVASDPELTLDRNNSPHHATLKGSNSWFDWEDGCISTKSPDTAGAKKLFAIAQRLSAKVQDDDGEFYTSPDQLPDAANVEAQVKAHEQKGNRFTLKVIIVILLASVAVSVLASTWKQRAIGIGSGIFWVIVLIYFLKQTRNQR
jgi:hypothetical protein